MARGKDGRPGRVEVRAEGGRADYAARVIRRRAAEFLAALGQGGAEVSVLLTTDPGIRRINREFRGKDKATDVLSFPAGDGPVPPGTPPFLGDLAISLDTARRRAGEDGRPLAAELSRYLAHGLLHLLGYDHERSAREAARMAREENRLLGGVGLIVGEGDPSGHAENGGKAGAVVEPRRPGGRPGARGRPTSRKPRR